MARQTNTARLIQKACISEPAQCYHLEFAIDEFESFDFTPGQFISTVATDPKGKSQTRAYSIASAPASNQFDLCVNRVEGGFFSNHLIDLPVGETVQVHGPHGNFTLRTPLTDSIFVATGTGIAPMRAFSQWLFPEIGEHAGKDRSEGRQIWLIFGMRHETDIYYRDYFERLAQEHSNFHYLVTLSRADQTWSGHRGYVQDHLDSIIASRKAVASSVASSKSVSVISSSEPIGEAVSDTVVAVEEALIADPAAAPAFDIHTYICGLNDMVAGVRARLTEFGWHKKQIVFERYD